MQEKIRGIDYTYDENEISVQFGVVDEDLQNQAIQIVELVKMHLKSTGMPTALSVIDKSDYIIVALADGTDRYYEVEMEREGVACIIPITEEEAKKYE